MDEKKEMQRGLKNRHIQMIALGTAIGTGLFYVSAGTIQLAGPATLISYMISGFVIFLIMRMLGEMAVENPISGSFSAYAYQYWGELPGFLLGWNYWFTYVITSMLELSAVGVFMDYWWPGLPHWITAFVCLIVITGVNMINVKAYGEFEFWFTIIKVTAVLSMIVFGIALILGVGGGKPMGLSNLWVHGGFFPNGFSGVLMALVVASFTFGGVEALGTTAGEVENPKKTIPKAINQVMWRILIFYVGAIGVMLIIWPWNKVGMEGSPFVLILAGLGVKSAATILNVVVIVACLSVYNCAIYSNARMLHSLAGSGNAPKIFTYLNKRGVPSVSLLGTSGLTVIAVVLNYIFPDKLIMYLIGIILAGEIITWGSIAVINLKFHKKIGAGADSLTFKTPFYPYSNYFCIGFLVFLLIMMSRMDDFKMAAYLLPFWILILCFGYLLKKKGEKNLAGKAEAEVGKG